MISGIAGMIQWFLSTLVGYVGTMYYMRLKPWCEWKRKLCIDLGDERHTAKMVSCWRHQCIQQSIHFLPLFTGTCCLCTESPSASNWEWTPSNWEWKPWVLTRDSVNSPMHLVKTKWETKLDCAHFKAKHSLTARPKGWNSWEAWHTSSSVCLWKQGMFHLNLHQGERGTQQKGISRSLTWVSHDCCCSMQF